MGLPLDPQPGVTATVSVAGSRWRPWLPLLIGAVLALLALNSAHARFSLDLADAGLGAETANFLQTGIKTQCSGAGDSGDCLASWRKAGAPPTILWFGNSQLAGINRYQPGDLNAPERVHRALAARSAYLVTYSQPNANLTEQAIVWNAVGPIYRPKLLILPVCYDDIRELGVRAAVAEFADQRRVMARLRAQPYWPPIAKAVEDGAKIAAMPTAAHASLQGRVEAAATGFLREQWPLWRDRDRLRGVLGFALHVLRNQTLGIHSTTKRPVDAHVYADRMMLLDGLLADVRAKGTDVLLYVPPYRQDIDGPYLTNDYRAFKRDLQALAARHGAGFADLDPIVPGPEWAVVTDEVFGFQEPDFMHFTAAGHRRLAAGIDDAVRRMGY
jgi:hypothetical protein